MDKDQNFWDKQLKKWGLNDGVILVTAAGDAGVNCIWAFTPFGLSPSWGMFVKCTILAMMCCGISFSVPSLGRSAAQVRGALPNLILALTLVSTSLVSILALNGLLVQNGWESANINLYFVSVPGNILTSYCVIGLALVLAINNGYRPFILEKAKRQNGGAESGKPMLREVA